GRVQPDRGAPVLGRDPATRLYLVEDRLRDLVAGPERVGELLALAVEQHRAVSGIEYPCIVGGQAPPFGWYWRASRSRASAPASSAIRVVSPVALGWFVESSPRRPAS